MVGLWRGGSRQTSRAPPSVSRELSPPSSSVGNASSRTFLHLPKYIATFLSHEPSQKHSVLIKMNNDFLTKEPPLSLLFRQSVPFSGSWKNFGSIARPLTLKDKRSGTNKIRSHRRARSQLVFLFSLLQRHKKEVRWVAKKLCKKKCKPDTGVQSGTMRPVKSVQRYHDCALFRKHNWREPL